MKIEYYGQSKRYNIGKELGKGSEGNVYEVSGEPDKAIKIYKETALCNGQIERSRREKRIKAMLQKGIRTGDIDSCGSGTVIWPEEIIRNRKGDFCGFLMARLKNSIPLAAIELENERELRVRDYDWTVNLKAAWTMAAITDQLHQRNIIIGDWNKSNIRLTETGSVVFIDADSYTLCDKEGIVYKTMAGRKEYLPPELQDMDLSRPEAEFTIESDCFALSVHIYELLFNGEHPFDCADQLNDVDSVSKSQIVVAILDGRVPSEGTAMFPVHSPDVCKMIPAEVRLLFHRAFGYASDNAMKSQTIRKRPSPKEWMSALEQLQNSLVSCNKHPRHVYWRGCWRCPWCEMGMNEKYVINDLPGNYHPMYAPIKQYIHIATRMGRQQYPVAIKSQRKNKSRVVDKKAPQNSIAVCESYSIGRRTFLYPLEKYNKEIDIMKISVPTSSSEIFYDVAIGMGAAVICIVMILLL